MQNKRPLIIILASVAGMILIACIVVLVLILVRGNSGTTPPSDQQGSTQPGDNVSLSQTPDYDSCSVIPKATAASILGVSSLSEGTATGVIAPNYEIAEQCALTDQSGTSLTVRVYLRSGTTSRQDTEAYDSSWSNISKVFYPEYSLTYPAYFKSSDTETTRTFEFELNTSARHYNFRVEQPLASAVTVEKGIVLMATLASAGDYTIKTSDDIPPAPTNSN